MSQAKQAHTISSIFQNCFEQFWERPAVSNSAVTLTYKEVYQKMTELLRLMQIHGLNKDHFIGISLQRDLNEYIATLSLLFGQYTALNLGNEGLNQRNKEICTEFNITHLLISKTNSREMQDLNILFSFEDFYCVELATNLPKPPCSWLLMTSGSTGKKKMVMISEENILKRAQGEIELFALNQEDVIFNYLSFSHDLGLNQILSAFLAGCHLIIHRYIFLPDLMLQLEKTNATVMTSIPNLWRNLLKNQELFKREKSSLRLVTISGGSLSTDEIFQLQQLFKKISLIKTYGQTETFRTLVKEITAQDNGSLGSPLNCVKVELENGELVHYGAGTMLGYWKDPENTLKKFNSKGGILTGDLFSLSPDGQYQFSGRKDSMLKLNGVRFYPEEIENQLIKNDNIRDCAITLVKEANGLESIVAFIVLKKSIETKILRNSVQKLIPAFFSPRHLIISQDLPKTESGKIDRMQLQVQAENFLLRKNNE